eukprot:RCo008564
MPSNKTAEQETSKEFGGTLGTAFLIVFLPAVICTLFFACNANYCLTFANVHEAWSQLWPVRWEKLYSHEAMAVVVGWIAFQSILAVSLPGKVVSGVTLKDGSKLQYLLNAHLSMWVTLATVGVLHFSNLAPLSFIYHHYSELVGCALLMAFFFAGVAYLASFRPGILLASGGNTGSPIYDFFMGRELNPRVCPSAGARAWDVKCSLEIRVALVGWAVINLAMLAEYYARHQTVLPAMACLVALQFWYVWDCMLHEPAFLTTFDVTTDGFGFMLAQGNIAWVPFTYSLQARFLVDYPVHMPAWALVAILALNMAGYVIFRGANSQKDAFRKDPASVPHIRSMPTRRGTKLITSGWWGMARKINYTGDWMIGLSWCLLCGFHSPMPYFYATYFAALLIHRALRDDHACQLKYGADWDKYKKLVPYMFIPYVV